MLVSVIRHAETVANRERIIQGQQEGALTEYGQKQAKRLAKRLQLERVDFVYTSDLKRARQTTKKIAKRHPDAIVIRDRRLREKAAGIFEGSPVGSCSAAARAAGIAEREFRPEGGESWTDVEGRAADFWRFLVAKHVTTTAAENVEPVTINLLDPVTSKLPHIVIVSHSGFIQSLLLFLSQQGSMTQVDFTKSVTHASLTTLSVHSANMHLLRVNDVAHLKGLAKPFRPLGQECALKVKPNPMKRSVATSPPRAVMIDLALRQRPADDRPVPAAARAASPVEQRLQQSSS